MHFSHILTILALGAAGASATTLNLFSGTSCEDDNYIITLSGLKPGCQKFGVANVKAVNVRQLSDKCTVTVYSDIYCTDNPTAARLKKCVTRSGQWKSFSIDNC
ncbi:hypothetical protein B0J11DRAFT_599235 [Dendryphion nanum]|uniref:Uncharacterized protein n=1 Tax=Dendryphion nanum TaxID=256645 RepID=A0A9P9I7A4_9PLEO|nr:hypothetical protein B0J11DRAFT_599235 [Dendryphion nanum]